MSFLIDFQNHIGSNTLIATSFRDRLRLRSRNHSHILIRDKNTPLLPFGFLIQKSIEKGVSAFRQTWIPALIVQSLISLLILSYFFVPQTHFIFDQISQTKQKGGWIASFLLMGGVVGLLSEIVLISSTTRKWTKVNTENFIYNFIVFGVIGILTDFFYIFQAHWVGTENNAETIFIKMLVDQFLWTPFFALPLQVILGKWKNFRYQLTPLFQEMNRFDQWIGRSLLPALFSCWGFWIPMCSLIYCFPTPLQFPMVVFAVSLWVILLNTVMKTSKNKKS